MCHFLSSLVCCTGEPPEFTIVCDPEHTDSHRDLREAHHVHDTEARRMHGRSWVAVEYTPPDGPVADWCDVSKWTLRLDDMESAPDWWTTENQETIRRRLATIVERMVVCDERGTVLGGCWILAPDGRIAKLIRGRLAGVAVDANLSGAYLYGANLSDANLSGANLSDANLSGANLSDANLSGAYLSDANLSDANLSGANLSGAYLSGAYLSGAYLSDANLSGANLSGAYLSDANLSGANLSGAYLSDANLSGAYLSGAYLSDANLSGAYLSDANLSGANLSGANLSGAYRYPSDPDIPGWELVNGVLRRKP